MRGFLGLCFALLVCFSSVALAADTAIEGESMTYSTTYATVVNDSAASGGKSLKWSEQTAGKASKTITTTASEKIVVRAKATASNGVYPEMAVYVDGTKVSSTRELSGSYADYTFTKALTAGSHKIEVEGVYMNGRSLTVDKVTAVEGTTTQPPPPDSDGDGGETVTGSGLEISGNQFTLDGNAFDMTGVRTGSASQSQALTDELISNLDTYKAHDVNTIAVYYMGTSGGSSDPFAVDASGNVRIEADDAARMRQIIEAADARDMVVVVGIFYQRANWTDITTDARVVKAINAVVDDLVSYDNIIINIANEQNSGAYADKPGNIQSASQIVQYINQVKNRDPHRLVGGGGYKDASNVTIGKAANTDALLFDTGGYEHDFESSGVKYDKYRAAGVPDKPLVNVEILGGYTAYSTIQPSAGCYTATGKQQHLDDIDDARVRPGLSVFFHSNKWIQGGSTHYELGGSGTCNSTTNNPGMRWWFTYVRDNG